MSPLIAGSLIVWAALVSSILTPGVVRPLSTTQVCTIRWGLDRRHVTESMRKQVFASYGIDWATHAEYEVDHLIPRELAGADDVRNLWPQPWPEARLKDRLENKLHKLTCQGTITLRTAQTAMRTDWRVAYEQYIGRP